jgi:hypothetical protein
MGGGAAEGIMDVDQEGDLWTGWRTIWHYAFRQPAGWLDSVRVLL